TPALSDDSPGAASAIVHRRRCAIYRTSDNYAGTDIALPRGGRRVLWDSTGLRYPPHAASRQHEYAAACENRATQQEESARRKARKKEAYPCWRLACFPFAWRWPVTVPVPPLRAPSC